MGYADPEKERACQRRRDARRNKRPRGARAQTLSPRGRVGLPVLVDYPEGVQRPRTRGECNEARGYNGLVLNPCPFVSCRHHLYLDVSTSGGLKLNFPELEPDELLVTCSLDVADTGLVRLEDAGALMNLTRERVRQVEVVALQKLSRKRDLRELLK